MKFIREKIRNIKIGVVLVGLVFGFVGFGNPVKSESTVIYVPDDYSTIQESIDAANIGDKIIVRDGVYNEKIIIDKSDLSISSENGADLTIIQGALDFQDPFDNAVSITANNVYFNGFTVSGTHCDAHIFVKNDNGISGCEITNNYVISYSHMECSGDGIELENVSDCIINSNKFATAENINKGYNGIILRNSNNNLIKNNEINRFYYGIIFINSSDNILENNKFRESTSLNFYGDTLNIYNQSIDKSNTIDDKPIYYLYNENGLLIGPDTNLGYLGLINSSNILVKDLTKDNIQSILMVNTKDSIIQGGNVPVSLNFSSHNSIIGTDCAPISLSNSDYNIIASNQCSDIDNSDYDISLENSSYNILFNNHVPDDIALWESSTNNIVRNNKSDISFGSSMSSDNIVYQNDIEFFAFGSWFYDLPDDFANNIYLNNINDAFIDRDVSSRHLYSTNPIKYCYQGNCFNGYIGNHWNSYTGLSIDDDGIGDVPHREKSSSWFSSWYNDIEYPLIDIQESYSISDFYPVNSCSNGVKNEAFEQCDGVDFGGLICESYGFTKGELICTNECLISFENCVVEDEQNPTLKFIKEEGNFSDGVHPDKGISGTNFNFKVIYTDPANMEPAGSVKINILNTLEESQSFEMWYDSSAGDLLHNYNYADGEQFAFDFQYSVDGTRQVPFYFETCTENGNCVRLPEDENEFLYFEVGSWVKVCNTEKDNLNIRETPEIKEGNILKIVPDEWILERVDNEEIEQDNCIWWHVRDADFEESSVVGWASKEFLEEVLPDSLVPASLTGYFEDSETIDDRIISARDNDGKIEESGEWKGYCLRFVKDVYDHLGRWTSAFKAYESIKGQDRLYIPSSSWNPQKGALVFFDYYEKDENGKEDKMKHWGHVGIYTGDGKVMHMWDEERPVETNIESINLPYLGWAFPDTLSRLRVGSKVVCTDDEKCNIKETDDISDSKSLKEEKIVKKGSVMTVIEDTDNWIYRNEHHLWHVEYTTENNKKINGWLEEPRDEKEKKVWFMSRFLVKDIAQCTNDVCYVRKEHSTLNDDEIKKLKNGDIVEIIENDENLFYGDDYCWWLVKYGENEGDEGWCAETTSMVKLKSPGYLRVYDSQGRITGLVNGEAQEGIPFSTYDKENKKITISSLFPDNYTYEVVGTDEDVYGLEIETIGGGYKKFTATDIPTTPNEVHQYAIDWDALFQGEQGTTLTIDLDGDGNIEETITTGNTLDMGANLETQIAITKMEYGEEGNMKDILNQVTQAIGNNQAPLLLSELKEATVDLEDYTLNRKLESGQKKKLKMKFKFLETAGNEYQGKSINVKFKFLGT